MNMDTCKIPGDRNVFKKDAEKGIKYRNTAYVECKNTSETRGNRSHLKIIQIISEQDTWKARNQGTTENSHTEHCTRTEKVLSTKLSTW